MPWNRGDDVLCLYPNSSPKSAKSRPALVIQADQLNTGINQTILAMITSNMARAGHPCRVTVLAASPQSIHMGLLSDSVISTDNLATVFNTEIRGVIGHCSHMQAVENALRHTLSL